MHCLGFSLCPSFRGSLFMLFLCSLVPSSPSLPPTTLPFPILQTLRRELITQAFTCAVASGWKVFPSFLGPASVSCSRTEFRCHFPSRCFPDHPGKKCCPLHSLLAQ